MRGWPDMPKIPDLPTIGTPDGPGWRLRPKGWRDRGLDDRDPRGTVSGRERRGEMGDAPSLQISPARGEGASPHPNPLPEREGIGVPPEGEGTQTSHPYLLPVREAGYVELHCHTCYSFREGAS